MFKDKNEKINVNSNNQGIAVGKIIGNSNVIISSKSEKKEGIIKRLLGIILDVWEWFKK